MSQIQEQMRPAYRREKGQSLLREVGSLGSCLLATLLGFQRELTLSCVAEIRAEYGPTPEERLKGKRMKKFINSLPFNRNMDDHCREALRQHVATWLLMDRDIGFTKHRPENT